MQFVAKGSASAWLCALLVSLAFSAVDARAGVTISLSAAPNPVQLGQSVTLTATLNPAGSTGKVTFYDGLSVLGTVSISSGTATLATSGLGAGSHAVYARYVAGVGQPSGASNQINETVDAKPGGGFVPFVPANYGSYPTPTIPFNSTFSGDLNHDGYPDLITTSSYGNSTGETISVFINKGTGAFDLPANYLNAGNCFDVMIADMDLDGNPDLVAATNQGVALLRGNGNGTFASPITVESASDVTYVAVADVNSDGIPDLIVAHSLNAGPTRIEIILGNGDGSFRAGVSTDLSVFASSLALGDFNRDGIPDLAVGSTFGKSVVTLLGNGDGTFQAPKYYALDTVSSIVSADLNQDGIGDLVAGGPQLFTVLLGNGDGTFRELPPINIDPIYGTGDNITSIATTDLNGDGKIDLLVTYAQHGLLMMPGNGDGTFAAPFALPPVGGSAFEASNISVADFNHDGVADLAMGPYDQYDNWTYYGKPSPILSITASPNPASASQTVTLTVTSSFADATGTLQFENLATDSSIGMASLSGGSATLKMASPGSGTYVVVATYSGDSKYVATKTPQVPILFTQPGPGINLTASPNPAQVG